MWMNIYKWFFNKPECYALGLLDNFLPSLRGGWVREKEHFSGIIAERILEFVPYVVCLHRSNDVKELSVDKIAIKIDTGNFKATTLDTS